MKGSRRRAREDALKILFQLDMNSGLAASRAVGYFEQCFTDNQPVNEFTLRLVQGVADHIGEMDGVISRVSEHWRSERMASVDRNLLRLGIFELKYCDDVPATVTINEMIELAKEYGAEGSPSFVNGVLDRAKNLVVPSEGKAL